MTNEYQRTADCAVATQIYNVDAVVLPKEQSVELSYELSPDKACKPSGRANY